MKPVEQGPDELPMSPKDVKLRLDENGRVISNLPSNYVLERQCEMRNGERVVVGMRIKKISDGGG